MPIDSRRLPDFTPLLLAWGWSREQTESFQSKIAKRNSHQEWCEILASEGIALRSLSWDEWVPHALYPAFMEANGQSTVILTAEDCPKKSVQGTPTVQVLARSPVLQRQKKISRNWMKFLPMVAFYQKKFRLLSLSVLTEKALSIGIALTFATVVDDFVRPTPIAVVPTALVAWGLLRFIQSLNGVFSQWIQIKFLNPLHREEFISTFGTLIGYKENGVEFSVGNAWAVMDGVTDALIGSVSAFVSGPILILIISAFAAYLFSVDSRLLVLPLFFYALLSTLNYFFGKALLKLKQDSIAEEQPTFDRLSEVFNNSGALRVYQREEWGIELWRQRFSKLQEIHRKSDFLAKVNGSFAGLISSTIFFLTFYLVYDRWKIAPDSVGRASALSLLITFFIGHLESLADVISTLLTLSASLDVIPEPAMSREEANPASLPAETLMAVCNLKFFVGEGGSRNKILDGVSLEISRKEWIGVAGENGSGKSTLIKTITGLLRVEPGSIQRNILAGEIFALMKEDRLFRGTLMENFMRLSDAGSISESDLQEVLDLVGLADFYGELPLGMKTPVFEIGQNFSAGENLRFLIAIALLRKPKILIFDEATSSLAVDDEISFLTKLRQSKWAPEALIVVSHRSEVFQLMDTNYQMTGGKLKKVSGD